MQQKGKVAPSLKRRQDEADAKRSAKAARKADISEIGKRRTDVEKARVCLFSIVRDDDPRSPAPVSFAWAASCERMRAKLRGLISCPCKDSS